MDITWYDWDITMCFLKQWIGINVEINPKNIGESQTRDVYIYMYVYIILYSK